jgi:hypothetical protein
VLVVKLYFRHVPIDGGCVRKSQVAVLEKRARWKRAACNHRDRIMALTRKLRGTSPINVDLEIFFLHL